MSSEIALKDNQESREQGKEEKFPLPTLEDFSLNNINIGIIGKSGAGKSSFVNRYLDLKNDQRAETGVTETTGVKSGIKYYEYNVKASNGVKRVLFWDLSGISRYIYT